jgi:outer membrane scaffolding protein for murein synthesis (MipA/OmpV family)
MGTTATIKIEMSSGSKAFAVALVAFFASANIQAGSLIDYIRDYDLNNYSLGVAVSVSQNPYEGSSSSTFAYPYLTSFRHSAFTDDWLLIRGENVGFRYITENDWEFGLIGRIQTLGLGDGNLPGLEERNWAVEMGPLIGWRAWPVHAQFRSYREVPDRHSGGTSELELSLPREFSRGFFVPSVMLMYMSGAYSRYYFGVAESEVAPERATYDPGTTLSYRIGFSLGYELTPQWLLKTSLSLDIFDSAITASPLIDSDYRWSGSIGLAYNADLFQPKDHGGAFRPGSVVVRASAFSSKFSTDIRHDASSGTTGDDVDFEDFLGDSGSEPVLQTEIRYRIGFYHRLKATFFETDRDLAATLEQDFAFGDELFLAGTEVASRIDTRRLSLLYGYSLMRDAQKELGVQAGIVYSRIELDVVAAETQQAESATLNAPLPTMGLFGSVALGEHWELGAEIGVFALDLDRYSGYSGQASLTLDRMLGDSIAVGIGFDYFVTRLESQDEEFRGLLRSRNYGPKAYLSWIF